MLDIADRLCEDHVDEVLDIADRPNHVEVNAEFGTDISLARAYVSRNESETRRCEACTQFVEQCGDDSLVIAHGPRTALGFVTIEHPSKQVGHPRSPCTITNCVIATA